MKKESSDPDDAEAQFVEVDPSGRYGRVSTHIYTHIYTHILSIVLFV